MLLTVTALFLLRNMFLALILIWITFCTHLLLYGIHLWADVDHDPCVGGSRPNQNDCFL